MRIRLLASALLLATVTGTLLFASDSKSNYIYKRGDRTTMMGAWNNFDELKRIDARYGNEYVWTRQNGREYVITDRNVLDEVRAITAELDQIEAPLRRLEERLRPDENELEKIERRADAISDQLDDDDTLSSARRSELQRQLRALQAEMRVVAKRMKVIEIDIDRLDAIVDVKTDRMEEQFEGIVARAIRAGKAKRVN
jgi:DNA repair exonuclease SbcCD ATPase subunit